MKTELPQIYRIEKIITEAKDVKTFVFKGKIGAKPGQFVAVWLPGKNEKPFGISYQDNEKFAVTVRAVGPFSREMHALKSGDKLGIRGPYGTHYKLEGKQIALVAGGYGAAPLAFLANEARKKKIKVDFVIGAKSKQQIIFEKRMKNAGVKVHIATEDGSCGKKCFSTDILETLLKKNNYSKVFACGPELMMKKVVGLSNGIPCEISMERYIKCGIGVCGSCCVDHLGIRMCKEGPVISKELAKKIFEFGKYKRDAAGRKVHI